MRTADDGAVGQRDQAVPIHIFEPDAARGGSILAGSGVGPTASHWQMGIRVGRIPEVAVRHQPVERADGGAHLVDDLIPEPCGDRTVEEVVRAIDLDDGVLVVAAGEGHTPDGGLAEGAAVAEGEINPGVFHLADIDDGRCRQSCRRRVGWVKQQVVRGPPVQVGGKIGPAFQEVEVHPDVHGLVLFPLQVRVPQGGLPKSGHNGRAGSADIVEGVSGAAAKLAHDAS